MLITLLGMIVFLHPDINLLFSVSIIALQLLRESYLGLPIATLMEEREVQAQKGLYPIFVTLSGMMTETKSLQPLKTVLPIVVTLLGIVIEDNSRHSLNASSPMAVTLLGISVFLQPATKQLLSVSIIALQLLRESYRGLPDTTLMTDRLLLPQKIAFAILETLLGMVTESKFLHQQKAYSPILVTLYFLLLWLMKDGIKISPEYLPSGIDTTCA